jgi:hypothetical protein
MALNVVQVEAFQQLLLEVPRLVDRIERRSSGLAGHVLDWLKRVEAALENNKIASVSRIAALRAQLLQAGRGVQGADVQVTGRPTRRKIEDATAAMALQRGNQLLHDVIAERESVFGEAERLMRQLVAVAEAKGIVRACREHVPAAPLPCIQQAMAADADLAGGYVRLVSLVGKYDAAIFLDRALPF